MFRHADGPKTGCVHERGGYGIEDAKTIGSSTLPNELLTQCFAAADIATLARLSVGRGLPERIVRRLLRTEVMANLKPWLDYSVLPDFFHALLECRGFVFGDVAFSVLTRSRIHHTSLDVAVPRARSGGFARVLLKAGYKERRTNIRGQRVFRNAEVTSKSRALRFILTRDRLRPRYPFTKAWTTRRSASSSEATPPSP